MSVKAAFTGALIAALTCLAAAPAQTPTPTPGNSNGVEKLPTPRLVDAPVPAGSAAPLPGDQVFHQSHGLSDWITYHRDGCEGEMNGTPILSELYVRSGASFPMGGEILGKLLQPGWTIGGGARALFFNSSTDAAWTIEAGITNIHNHSSHADVHIPLTILVPNAAGGATRVNFGNDPGVPGVTVREYNRTTVDLAFGRELYLLGSATDCGSSHWRVGIDGGGRYGSAKAEFREIRHRTDVIGGVFASAHTDLEFPCGCCVFYTGLRVEFGYTWGDILQRQSDVYDVNVLLNVGVRY